MLSDSCSGQLEELKELLLQLQASDYRSISPVFRKSSIGQHVRHILELFDCLVCQSESGVINYDLRERNLQLESDPAAALAKITELQSRISISDRELILFPDQNPNTEGIKTTYNRELLYNLEHCVHHQALIRLACFNLSYVSLPESFGVANSTIRYQAGLAPKN